MRVCNKGFLYVVRCWFVTEMALFVVREGFVIRISRFLGFLREFDILTALWQWFSFFLISFLPFFFSFSPLFFSLFFPSFSPLFFSLWFVWKEGDYIMEIRVKKMGFECAIGPLFT